MVEKIKPSNRSYGQFCGVARALDVVGDRWTLLIVRELLAGPMRYNELKRSLTGIATNLLAERLRALEEDGIVERRLGDSGALYALTAWGAELRQPMEALGRWAAPLLEAGRGEDSFQPRWLVLALPALLRGVAATPPVELGVEVEGSLIVLCLDEDGPHAVIQPNRKPDTILTATPEIVVALAAGALTIDQALATGHLEGDVRVLHSIFPSGRETAMP